MTQPHTNPPTEHEALREAIETGVLGFVWSTGDATAVADAVLTLPDITALRGAAEESEKRLDALIAVRRERDALRAAVQRVDALLDHMARNRAYDLGTVQVIRRALDGDDRTGQR